MTNTTNNNIITNAKALAYAADFLADAMPDFTEFCAADPYACDSADVLAKLRKMHETATKPRKKPEGETEAHKRNRENATKLADMVSADEVLTTTQVCEKLGLLYPATATAVMNVGVELGIWERVSGEKKSAPRTYKLAARD